MLTFPTATRSLPQRLKAVSRSGTTSRYPASSSSSTSCCSKAGSSSAPFQLPSQIKSFVTLVTVRLTPRPQSVAAGYVLVESSGYTLHKRWKKRGVFVCNQVA